MARERFSDLTTAAGLSAATAGVVGAAALIGRFAGRPATDAPADGDTGGPAGSAASSRQRAATAPAPDAAFKPDDPTDLHKPTVLYSLRKTAREFSSDQCTDIAASLVYFAVLAIGPGIIAIVSILGLVDAGAISALERQVLQPAFGSTAAYSTVKSLLDNATAAPAAGVGLVVGILGALWSASGYVGAFGRAMNRVYSIPEGRPVWKVRPVQLAVTLVIVILFVIGALLLVTTGSTFEAIAGQLGIGGVLFTVFSVVKWPILVLLAVAGIAILYYFSPNIRQPRFRWTSTGSILALLVWALATAVLVVYLTVSGGGSYAKSYGAIAGVIVFLLWLWITNIALLFGAEFDAELERARELQAGIAAEEQIQLPPRDTRQSDKKAAQHEQDVQRGRRLRQSRGRD